MNANINFRAILVLKFFFIEKQHIVIFLSKIISIHFEI